MLGAEDLREQRRVGRQIRPQRERRDGVRVIARPPRWCRPWILQHDAHGGEFVADAVGFGEVLRLARVKPRGDPRRDLGARELSAPARAALPVVEAHRAQAEETPACRRAPCARRDFEACISAIAFGVLRSSASASRTAGAGRGSASSAAASNHAASAFSASSRSFSVQLIGWR